MPLVAYRQPQHLAICANVRIGTDGAGSPRFAQRRVVLKPGLNQIGGRAWDQVKDHPLLKRRLAAGQVEVLSEETTPQAQAQDLKDLRVNEARTLVRETVDVAVLEQWLEAEDRKTVTADIEKQLSKVSLTQDQAEKQAESRGRGRRRASASSLEDDGEDAGETAEVDG